MIFRYEAASSKWVPLTNMYSEGGGQKQRRSEGYVNSRHGNSRPRTTCSRGWGTVSERIYLAAEGVMEKTLENPDERSLLGKSNDKLCWASQWAELPVKGHAKLRLGWTLLIACETRSERIWAPAGEWLSIEWVWESRLSNLDLTTRWGPPTSLSADSVCSPAKSDVITCFIMAPLGKSWSLARCLFFMALSSCTGTCSLEI